MYSSQEYFVAKSKSKVFDIHAGIQALRKIIGELINNRDHEEETTSNCNRCTIS